MKRSDVPDLAVADDLQTVWMKNSVQIGIEFVQFSETKNKNKKN
jgi:hypothetical protein